MKVDVSVKFGFFNKIIKSKKNQRILLILISIGITFLIIHNGAIPKRYKLTLNKKSNEDINAPRDIENVDLTEKKALDAMEKVNSYMDEIDSDIIIKAFDDVFDVISNKRYSANSIGAM